MASLESERKTAEEVLKTPVAYSAFSSMDVDSDTLGERVDCSQMEASDKTLWAERGYGMERVRTIRCKRESSKRRSARTGSVIKMEGFQKTKGLEAREKYM